MSPFNYTTKQNFYLFLGWNGHQRATEVEKSAVQFTCVIMELWWINEECVMVKTGFHGSNSTNYLERSTNNKNTLTQTYKTLKPAEVINVAALI